MAHWLRILVILPLLASCAAHESPQVAPGWPREASYGLRVFSQDGLASACPVSDSAVLTSKHVVQRSSYYTPRNLSLTWGNAYGESGSLWYTASDVRRDLVIMEIGTEDTLSRFYPLAQGPPLLGSLATLAGFDDGYAMSQPSQVMVLENMIAGHLILYPAGSQGQSGSCVLNSRSEVIGIFQWRYVDAGITYGVASSVWGSWGPLSLQEVHHVP